jgi:single-stranded-DNA-specific exonuclease
MSVAVDRLLAGPQTAELVVIYGDYDVDGVTSTALLLETLEHLGWRVAHFLPNRRDEGYGLSHDGVEHCLGQFSVGLLLAVDCGSTAVEAIRQLRARGVDVLVLDHHQIAIPPRSPRRW